MEQLEAQNDGYNISDQKRQSGFRPVDTVEKRDFRGF